MASIKNYLTCIIFLVRLWHTSAISTLADKGTFHNPIFDPSWPDPYCFQHADGYYYMPRREDDRKGIGLFRSKRLSDWRQAEKSVVLRTPPDLMSLWAPELHEINGNFYLYYCLDDGDNANHRMYVSRALNPKNLMGNWTAPKRLEVPGDDFWAIDATILKYTDNQLYIIWSGLPSLEVERPQNLYIARLCDPETVCTERVLIAEPIYSWEQNVGEILEGPQVLQRGNRTLIIYSGSASWTAHYNLGMMGIDNGKDPLNSDNWWRHDQPVFWRNDQENVYGVGHASFTKSPGMQIFILKNLLAYFPKKIYNFLRSYFSLVDFLKKDGTEDWIVYHAMEKPDAGWDGRTSRIERFFWNSANNTPIFPRPSGFANKLKLPSGELCELKKLCCGVA